jgi:hypothetical protein
MTSPSPRPRESVEEIAVPKWNIVEDTIEAVGKTLSNLLRDHVLEAASRAAQQRTAHTVRLRPERSEQDRPRELIIFPRLDEGLPWGASQDNPAGEGSEDTAVPEVDPVEVRLGHLQEVPPPDDPLSR